MNFFVVVIAVVILVALFIGTMALNESTPVPEECKEAYNEAQSCKTCAFNGVGCGFRDAMKYMKEVKKK
ncbi:MAG: hypothetical protein ACLFTZ_02490 [Acholeplasmataceae bacterium]